MSRFPVAAAAALSLALAAPAAAQQPQTVTIQVYSYGFLPHSIRLAAGRPVTLRFINSSGSGHDFTATTFFASSNVTSGSAPDGEIELAPHETKSITLIPRAGTFKAHCSHFFHEQMGMSDQIIVS